MIDILLATYNGEKFIRPQIESILSQTFQDFNLIIQDDGSSDGTVDILRSYQAEFPDKISVFENRAPTGCATKNFLSLAQRSTSDYVMFCDQDDVWLPDKVKITYRAIKELEQESENKDIPLLIHTDLQVVDENLNLLNKSLFRYQKMNLKRDKLNNLLVQNIVTGCTVMCNKKLVELLNWVADDCDLVIMHDWWMALIATTFGKVKFVDQGTILYRQHQTNQVGAKKAKSLSYLLGQLANFKIATRVIDDTYSQAGKFLDIYQQILSCEKIKIIKRYVQLNNYNKPKKIFIMVRYGFFKYGFLKKIGQIIKVLFF